MVIGSKQGYSKEVFLGKRSFETRDIWLLDNLKKTSPNVLTTVGELLTQWPNIATKSAQLLRTSLYRTMPTNKRRWCSFVVKLVLRLRRRPNFTPRVNGILSPLPQPIHNPCFLDALARKTVPISWQGDIGIWLSAGMADVTPPLSAMNNTRNLTVFCAPSRLFITLVIWH